MHPFSESYSSVATYYNLEFLFINDSGYPLQVQYPSTGSKALLQHAVNKENICMDGTKEKPRTTKINSLTVKGKGNVTVDQKCIARGVSAGRPVRSHRTTEHNLQKGDKAGSTALTNSGIVVN